MLFLVFASECGRPLQQAAKIEPESGALILSKLWERQAIEGNGEKVSEH
jgi:hypothetical protein